MEIVIEYGTTLHVRYPAPIVASSASGGGPASPARYDDDNGLVPVVVQQPILYSAYASLNDDVGSDDVGSDDVGSDDESTGGRLLASYALRTDDVGDDRTTTATTTRTRTTTVSYPPPDPIVIRVAAGVDSDYLFVTVMTMMSALIGGLLVIRSLDSISVWC